MATRNTDLGHQLTDEELGTLEKRIASIYKQAAEDMQDRIQKYFARFAKLDEQQKAKLEAGEITEQQYKQWRLNQMGRGERFEALRDALAERMTEANEVAAAYINDATPSIYSLNRNYAAYTIEKVGGNVGFTLFDEQTVKRLIVEEPDVMPYYPEARAVDRGIDFAYGKRQITAQVTSGILQGDSIPNLTKRLQKAIPTMNRDSAVRAARTAVTAAQNGGRMASYKAASDMGIKVRKRWVSSKDGRTRDAHRKLDGKTVDWDDSFSSSLGKIRYPGDPRAKPANTYNCRCSLRTVEAQGIEAEARQMRVRDPKTGKNVLVSNMTYEQWQEWAKNR